MPDRIHADLSRAAEAHVFRISNKRVILGMCVFRLVNNSVGRMTDCLANPVSGNWQAVKAKLE
ncbi:MAG: hypothetical protein BroJett021_34060 [Chloroflexota bacterium]|nr:MAG: hypothetical protein BroJett021_34060 [Chloroflexota bacterium]